MSKYVLFINDLSEKYFNSYQDLMIYYYKLLDYSKRLKVKHFRLHWKQVA